MHVLLTCPRDLLFLLGVTVESRPGRRDPMSTAYGAMYELGGPVTQRRDRITVELPDPVDAVLALRALQRALPEYETRVLSVIASAASVELLDGDAGPVRVAWQWLAGDIEPLLPNADPLADDLGRGLCALFPFRLRTRWREYQVRRGLERHGCPAAIADQQLPPEGLVLWSLASAEPIVHVDRSPVVVGSDAACDLVLEGETIERRHVQLEHVEGDWLVRDLRSTSGFFVNNQLGGEHQGLQPGMVVHFPPADDGATPHALIVLRAT